MDGLCAYATGRASRVCCYFKSERAVCLKHKVVCGCRVQPQTGIRARSIQRWRLWGLFTSQTRWRGGRVEWDRKGYTTLRRIGISCEPIPHLAGSCENNSAAFTQFAAQITVVWVSCRVQAGGRRWARRLGRPEQLSVLFFLVCLQISVCSVASLQREMLPVWMC